MWQHNHMFWWVRFLLFSLQPYITFLYFKFNGPWSCRQYQTPITAFFNTSLCTFLFLQHNNIIYRAYFWFPDYWLNNDTGATPWNIGLSVSCTDFASAQRRQWSTFTSLPAGKAANRQIYCSFRKDIAKTQTGSSAETDKPAAVNSGPTVVATVIPGKMFISDSTWNRKGAKTVSNHFRLWSVRSVLLNELTEWLKMLPLFCYMN